MLAYGYIKEQLAAGGRSLHASVLDRREREGPGDDGGDAGHRAARIRSPASRSWTRRRSPASSPSWRPPDCTTTPASGCTTRACRPRAASAAASSPCRRASSASPSSRRRSTTPATACGRSGRSPTSRTRSAATRMPPRRRRPRRPRAKPSLRGIYGFAMLDIGHNFKQINPNWFDTMRVTKLPSFEDEFGQDNSTFAGVRQSRLGVQVVDADRARRPEDDVRVRAVRHRRRRGPDDVPAAPRLRRARRSSAPARRGARSWIPTCSRTRSSTGDRPGMVFFRNVQVRWMPIKGDSQPDARPRAPGRQRRPGRLRRPYRAAEHQGARSRCRTSPARTSYARDWGYVRVAGIAPGDQVGRHARRPVRPVRQRHRLGPEPQLEPQARQERRAPPAVRVRRRHPELHERLAGRHRHRQQLLEPGDADPRQADPDHRHSCVFLDHTWNEKFSSTVGYSRQDIDNTDGQAPDAFKTGQYALGNLLYYPAPNVMMGGELQWGRRENFSDGFQQRRLQGAVLVQVQLLVEAWRIVMIDVTDASCVGAVAARPLRRWRSACRRSTRRRRPTSRRPSTPPTRSSRTLKEGKNADYIPALAKVDPNLFGIAVVTADGKVYTAGDIKTEVSIQSISKVFTMAQVIQEQGLDVDREADRRRRDRRALQLDHRRRRRQDRRRHRRAGDEPARQSRARSRRPAW